MHHAINTKEQFVKAKESSAVQRNQFSGVGIHRQSTSRDIDANLFAKGFGVDEFVYMAQEKDGVAVIV